MPTFQEVLDIIAVKHESLNDLWEKWSQRLDDENKSNIGMLLFFLCEEHTNIKKNIGEEYYTLLNEVAKIVQDNNEEDLAAIINPDFPKMPSTNPLTRAILHADTKAVKVLLHYTPTRAINLTSPFKNGLGPISCLLSLAMIRKIDKDGILEIIKWTESRKALAEALQLLITRHGWGGCSPGKKEGIGNEDCASLKKAINKRIDILRRFSSKRKKKLQRESESGSSITSMFHRSHKKAASDQVVCLVANTLI